ncbi:MAG: CHASE2 domain-containing protein [Proteobacteria bacterium]|nr:CHASE2 domain-containing protein [Pseudomonadota bacterium]
MATEGKGVPPSPNVFERAAARFIKTWGLYERALGRTLSALASRLRFTFFLAMTAIALGFLFWDYYGIGAWAGDSLQGGHRSLSAVEDSLFDWVIARRPIDPAMSGKVVVAEIDECSISHFEKKGLPGWPWPRDRHADLLTALGDAGVATVGYDVLFLDKSTQADSDEMLSQVAGLGAPTFFAANFGDATEDTPATSTVNRWPAALPLVAKPKQAPQATIQLPYAPALAQRAGFVNIERSGDAMVRDFPLWQREGDWGVPSMAVLVAAQYLQRKFTSFPQSIRLNWRPHHPLPVVSAVDLLPDEHTPCLKPGQKLPDLKGKIVLVGYVASGINDFKPTPIDPQMAGVVLQGEAVENLVDDTWIRLPHPGFKYLLSAILIAFIGWSFWRGEPSQDIDAIFTATNLVLTAVAMLTLTFSTYFFDIFTVVGISLSFFGLCRTYLAGMRGRALGNDDHVPELGEHGRLHVVLLILRVSVGEHLEVLGHNPQARRFWETNEYRRQIRRALYAHGYAKMHEGLIERKTFLASDFREVILMICDAPSVEELRWEILHDLKLINEVLAKIAHHHRLEQVVTANAAYVDLSDMDQSSRSMALQNTLGKVLQMPASTSLRAFIAADVECLPRYIYPGGTATPATGETPCASPSES